jgi:preprotein translocase subunit SecF
MINSINWRSLSKMSFIFSCVIMAVSISYFITKGVKTGIDFSGGYEYIYSGPMSETLSILCVKNCKLTEVGEKIIASTTSLRLSKELSEIEHLSERFISPKIGGEIKDNALISISLVFAALFLYITFKYNFIYSAGAIFALFHDILITLLLMQIIGIKIDIGTISAILAIAGYSLNDTIVVFDRIKKQIRLSGDSDLNIVVKMSISSVIRRTMLTSITTLSVIISLIIFSTNDLNSFAVTMMLGVILGTYSSLFVVLSFVFFSEKNKIDAKKEKYNVDDGGIL